MLNLTINGKEYTLEYTIEASLYSECTEKITSLLSSVATSASDEDLNGLLKNMSNIPQTTLTMFYAGLLENHSDEVESINDAKALIKQLMKENKEDENLSNFYGIMQKIVDCMADDGFFEQTGLTKLLNMSQTEEENVVPIQKATQKKTTKAGNK